jgi:uncharacterized protein
MRGAVRRTTTSGGRGDKKSPLIVAPTSFAVGSLAGLLGSLAGMGGGFVMIPLMTTRRLGLRLTQHEAHGTSLFAVAATGLAGAYSYGDTVRYPEAAAVALTAMVTARWGAQTTVALSERALKRALGWLILAMAPMVPAKAYYLHQLDQRQQQQQASSGANDVSVISTTIATDPNISWRRFIAPALIGVGSGFLAGLFGVGGGTIVVPALTMVTDMTHHEALGTSLAAMTLPAMTGTYSHLKAGNCSMRVAPFLAAGALVGAFVGAQQSLQTNENALRWGFSALLATIGVRTLLKA